MEQLYYQGNLFSSLGRKKHTFLPNFREEKLIFGIGRRKKTFRTLKRFWINKLLLLLFETGAKTVEVIALAEHLECACALKQYPV